MQKVRKNKQIILTAKIINNFKRKTNNFPSQYWSTIRLLFYLGFEDGAPFFKIQKIFHQNQLTLKIK